MVPFEGDTYLLYLYSMQETSPQNENLWWRNALDIFSKITAWVAIPVIVALVLGKYLDTRWGTKPWAFLILTGIAFIISLTAIGFITTKYIRSIESAIKDKKNDNNNK